MPCLPALFTALPWAAFEGAGGWPLLLQAHLPQPVTVGGGYASFKPAAAAAGSAPASSDALASAVSCGLPAGPCHCPVFSRPQKNSEKAPFRHRCPALLPTCQHRSCLPRRVTCACRFAGLNPVFHFTEPPLHQVKLNFQSFKYS